MKLNWILLPLMMASTNALAKSSNTNVLKAFECKIGDRRALIHPQTDRLGDQRYMLKHLFAEDHGEIFAKIKSVNTENGITEMFLRTSYGGLGTYRTAEVKISEVDGSGKIKIEDYNHWVKSSQFYNNGEVNIELTNCRSVRYRFSHVTTPWVLEKPFDWSRPDDIDDTGNYY